MVEADINSTSWHGYTKIYTLGHRVLRELLKTPVIVEEKLDGSQFSFGIFDGEIRCRSKGAVLNIIAPEKMFTEGVEVVKSLADKLIPGWTYRGEYFKKPKHNTLAYSRIPAQHIAIFDINDGHESYLSPERRKQECDRLGLECVPVFFQGVIESPEMFRQLLNTESFLGGQKIEGVVIKNHALFGPDGKALMGKFVSEEFKEVHNGEWRDRNPGPVDIIELIGNEYATPARWNKSIMRLREQGLITDSPKDIGLIMSEIVKDVETECADEIREKLFAWGWSKVRRRLTGRLPEYYKEQLMKQQFEEPVAVKPSLT